MRRANRTGKGLFRGEQAKAFPLLLKSHPNKDHPALFQVFVSCWWIPAKELKIISV